MALKSLQDIDVANKVVFIRCDFNVPMDEFGNISDDRRIKESLSTIRYLLDADCKIILALTLEDQKGRSINATLSNRSLIDYTAYSIKR